MFPVFHYAVLYLSVSLVYLCACVLHCTNYGLQDRIPPLRTDIYPSCCIKTGLKPIRLLATGYRVF